MPQTIIPPGFAQCFLRWRVSGDNEEMLSSIGVRLQAGISDPVAISGAMIVDVETAWPLNTLGDAWTFVGVRTYVGSDGDYPVGESVQNHVGTSTTDMLPNNCALLTQKRTALGGRRNRGRMYWPSGFLGEGVIGETGIITAPTITTFQTRMNTLLTEIQTNPAIYDAAVILHSSTPATPTVVTSLTVDGRIATQRRRMRR